MLNHQELQLFHQPRLVTYLLKFLILPGVTGNWDQGISQWFKEKSVPDSEEKYLQDTKIVSGQQCFQKLKQTGHKTVQSTSL